MHTLLRSINIISSSAKEELGLKEIWQMDEMIPLYPHYFEIERKSAKIQSN